MLHQSSLVIDVVTTASDLRMGVPCTLVDETPLQGGSHKVFRIIFQDSVQWAARTCTRAEDWEYDLRSTRILQHIKQCHPGIKAPEVFYKKDHPVLYSEWVSGNPLESWTLRIPLKKRHVFLTDFAEFLLQIWTTPPPGHVVEQDQHYSAWLTRSLDRGLRRTLIGTARWGDAIDYLIMRSMIPAYSAEVDHYTGLGLAHGDLNAGNIMKDNEFHLTG
ncbi:hypothetical protein N7466_008035 [Penicillium verhagenii]|uniref:uncharacterized protein n=1 Tax=Penicillium verhagenii TaxID=1562060 RepID=UPI002545B233|nr:uncharacterized protein N7466_008035 [Penicillium verhagenii]KAJ5923848.1 hypothetical protein N7466_008035 [Penicillium verhagenii]